MYSGYGSGFALIVVLFILLIIVGTSFLPVIINRINVVDVPVHIYQPIFVNEVVDGDTIK